MKTMCRWHAVVRWGRGGGVEEVMGGSNILERGARILERNAA